MIITIPIAPMGKPRMTRSDKWKKRPIVEKYWAFKKKIRSFVKDEMLSNVYRVGWIAYFPMPKSWSKKKKLEMKNSYHRQKPDRDNIDKAILDALFLDDSGVADGHLIKRWDDSQGPRIVLFIDSLEKENCK